VNRKGLDGKSLIIDRDTIVHHNIDNESREYLVSYPMVVVPSWVVPLE
jgi:hypothetical protein